MPEIPTLLMKSSYKTAAIVNHQMNRRSAECDEELPEQKRDSDDHFLVNVNTRDIRIPLTVLSDQSLLHQDSAMENTDYLEVTPCSQVPVSAPRSATGWHTSAMENTDYLEVTPRSQVPVSAPRSATGWHTSAMENTDYLEVTPRSQVPVSAPRSATGWQTSERLHQSTVQLLLQQNAAIKEELRIMKSTLFEILRRQKGLEAVRTGRLPAGVVLPLKLESDVKSMETKLLSPQFYTELLAFLANAGGDDTFECTSNVMSKLMDNDLIRDRYTWAGRSESKQSFSDLCLTRLVVDAVRKNPFTAKSTDAQIYKSIHKWIRGAPDRNGGRAERAKKSFERKQQRP